MEQKKASIFATKRNLVALIVWCALFVALLAGVIVNAVLYANETLEKSLFLRRLFYAGLCWVMMTLVYGVELLFRFRFSLFLELALSCFAFIALAGGTVYNLYTYIPFYDKVLHAFSGPLFSIVGLSFGDLLVRNQPQGKRKVAALVLFAFCFSLAVGYLWEIFEFTVDSVIPGFDNQRWAAGLIESLPDGTYLVTDRRGTALLDTMGDIIANLCGTVVFLAPVLGICLKKPERAEIFAFASAKKSEQQK